MTLKFRGPGPVPVSFKVNGRCVQVHVEPRRTLLSVLREEPGLTGGQRCFAVRGENKYHAILGRGICQAVHASDPAVALVALEAAVTVAGPGGSRSIPLADQFQRPHRAARRQTVLGLDELIAETSVPSPAAGSRGTYVRAAERTSWDFALVSVAAQLAITDGSVTKIRIALGGVAPMPWRALEAEEALLGRPLHSTVIEQAADATAAGARSLAHNAYKIDLAQGLVRQALGDLS